MNRERWLIVYCLLLGSLGWIWLLLSGSTNTPWSILLLFLVLSLLIESAGFRLPPSDPHSLVGIMVFTGVLALGPQDGALVAALGGLIFGITLPMIYGRPRTLYLMAARPILRSGMRALAILLGAVVATAIAGGPPDDILLLIVLIPCYTLVLQLNRAAREYLQGGRTGVITWWRSSWRPSLSSEIAPLPFAALGAAIYKDLGLVYFILAGTGLLVASIAVRRATQNLRRQRRSVRELALLNETSRAIIRAELDVEALCELVYREASKIIDTTSFHLGLFEPHSDHYKLLIRVQDRVRLPPLDFDLPAGDGLVGWMRETGRALLVHDFAEEMARLPARPRYQSDRPPRSGIYVPLLDGETVIGSISVQSYRPNVFDTDDMRLLSLIADQAAVAISKARAFANAHQRAVQLQAIHEVSERITAILDLDELLPSVVRLIKEHFGYHPVHIFLLEDTGRLVFQASTLEGTELQRLRSIEVHEGQGIASAAAYQGQPVLINDVRLDPRYTVSDSQTRAELAVPLRFGDQHVGVLDVQSTEIRRFDESDLFVMQTLADQIAVAVESARAFTAQREEAWTLNALLQTVENCARASSLDELLPTVVRLPPLLLGCERCYCLVWDRTQATFTPLAAYGLTPQQRATFVGQAIPEEQVPLLNEVIRTVAPIPVEDTSTRHYICPPILDIFGGGALLALPLWSRGAALGVLVADYAHARTFASREMQLSMGIANQIAGALESALLAQEAAEVTRMDQELRVARTIQTALLPSFAPDLPGWDMSADWRSARLVGGDFFDFWFLNQQKLQGAAQREASDQPATAADVGRAGLQQLSGNGDDHSVGFVIADVSDKGVPAAMFMTLSRSLVRAAALDGSSPAVALTRANRWITRDSESGMFVTLFYGILETGNGQLRFTSAGHNPPLHFHADGSVVELKTPGIALGVLEDVTLGEAETIIEVGDLLICYTDGVTEAIDSTEEAFGVERLIEVVRAHRERSAQGVLTAITDALLNFTSGPLFDDVTLVIIKRVAEERVEASTE